MLHSDVTSGPTARWTSANALARFGQMESRGGHDIKILQTPACPLSAPSDVTECILEQTVAYHAKQDYSIANFPSEFE